MAVRTDTLDGFAGAAADEQGAARTAAVYMNPYLAGIGLGLVLLAAFVIMGRGLGASGAFNAFAAWIAGLVAPGTTRENAFLSEYLTGGIGHPLKSWLFFEVLGVFAGGLISALLASRVVVGVEKGPRASVRLRLTLAFAGGALSAVGAAIARGCTSGQALTGGSLLNLGSWVFMLSVFGGAYALAYFVRREWT
jgi:hypothetical protein